MPLLYIITVINCTRELKLRLSLRYIKFFLLLLFVTLPCFSQGLFIPLEFQDAYEEGTRQLDGRPGADYWQNRSDYKITVTLDPSSSMLTGSETITYSNNSPDTLDRIVIRLYQNITKTGTIKDYQFEEKDFTAGVTIHQLSVDKKNIDIKNDSLAEDTGTNLIIKNLSILPKKQAVISVSWDFKVPRESLRMGQYDSTTFFIAYWYPQVAVYDDIDGWDMIEYTGRAEFYNDFNDYDVKITVPNNYGIWAGGELKNPEDVLSPQILERYHEAMNSPEVVNIITANDYLKKMAIFNNKSGTNTWNFISKNSPDFSFALAANFAWDARYADATGNKKVFVTGFKRNSTLQGMRNCCKTVELLSKELPGVPFPEPKLTIFSGRGGMETPMMSNQSGGQRWWIVYVTTHETAHSYFPFYMGINERKYAWMDEGITQMLTEYIQKDMDTVVDRRAWNVSRYLNTAGKFEDVPMMYPSFALSDASYECQAYFRPCAAYNILKDFMGEAQFKKALQEYMKRWNGKHPTPYDFFFTFEDVTDDDYSWFWQPWFFNHGYPDLAIDTAYVSNNTLKIQISKEGELPVPVAINVKFKDGTEKKAYRSAAVWKSAADNDDDDDSIWIEMDSDKKILLIELGNEFIPDTDSTNNLWLFK
jgi:hypothetical protein